MGAFTLANEGGSYRECGLLMRLGVGYFFLSIGFHAKGILHWALQEIKLIVIIFAIFNGAEESEFLGIFGNFTNVFVFQQCFSHLSEFSPFSPLPCFGVVFGVREIEFGTAFTSEHAAVDVFEEFLHCFFVTGSFVVSAMRLVDVVLVSVVVRLLTHRGLLAVSHRR